MAGIDLGTKLPGTVLSRSIVIHLDRAAEDELAEEDVYDSKQHRKTLLNIGRKLARWCRDHAKQIADHQPKLPPKVRNRAAERWAPLLAIAQVAGGDWPKRAEAALAGQLSVSEPTQAWQLLQDIREVMRPGETIISSEELTRRLAALPDAPWAEYNFKARDESDPIISKRQVANLLKRYRISPRTVRIGESTAKGYRLDTLEKAWKKYLPPQDTPGDPSHTGPDVTHRNCRKPSSGAGCDAVTDTAGVSGK